MDTGFVPFPMIFFGSGKVVLRFDCGDFRCITTTLPAYVRFCMGLIEWHSEEREGNGNWNEGKFGRLGRNRNILYREREAKAERA